MHNEIDWIENRNGDYRKGNVIEIGDYLTINQNNNVISKKKGTPQYSRLYRIGSIGFGIFSDVSFTEEQIGTFGGEISILGRLDIGYANANSSYRYSFSMLYCNVLVTHNKHYGFYFNLSLIKKTELNLNAIGYGGSIYRKFYLFKNVLLLPEITVANTVYEGAGPQLAGGLGISYICYLHRNIALVVGAGKSFTKTESVSSIQSGLAVSAF